MTAAKRAPKTWSLSDECKIIVPVGGRAGLTSVRFVQATNQRLSDSAKAHLEQELRIYAKEETYGTPHTKLIECDDIVEALAEEAGPHDLIILGLRHQRGKRLFSELALQVARKTEAATLMISRRT